MGPVLGEKRPFSIPSLERTAVTLSLVAGAVHGVVSPQHFAEWWGYGLFFIFAAAAQVLFGFALLTNAINEADAGPNWWKLKRLFLAAGIGGNAFLVVLYVVSRTVGIPAPGPEAGTIETVAPIDIVAKAAELGLILVLAVLLRRGPEPSRGPAVVPP